MKSINDFLSVFKNKFDELDIDDKISVWNAYQDDISGDGQIYVNDEDFFNTFYSGLEPYDFALALEGTKWNSLNDYVWFNGYGDIESGNEWDVDISVSDIANNAYENKDFIYEIESFMDVDELVNFFD